MKKITLGVVLIILSGVLALSAQIMKPSMTINRDRTSIIQRLPSKIQSFVPQIRLPQPDSQNKNTAQNGHSLSSSFTLSPDALKVDGKGQIDLISALYVTTSSSFSNPVGNVPLAILESSSNATNLMGGYGVMLTVKNNQAGSLYLVDCLTYGASTITVDTGQLPVQTLTPSSNGHVYFVTTANSNDDVRAVISSNDQNYWAFFSCEISKLN